LDTPVPYTGTWLPGGTSRIAAVPVYVGSDWSRAVTVTVCTLVIVAGAVYSPEELIVPTEGLIDQVTAGVPCGDQSFICVIRPSLAVAG
jgi:hypothetical protein